MKPEQYNIPVNIYKKVVEEEEVASTTSSTGSTSGNGLCSGDYNLCHSCDTCLQNTNRNIYDFCVTSPSRCDDTDYCVSNAKSNFLQCVATASNHNYDQSEADACMVEILCHSKHTELCTEWRNQNCASEGTLMQRRSQQNLSNEHNQVNTDMEL